MRNVRPKLRENGAHVLSGNRGENQCRAGKGGHRIVIEANVWGERAARQIARILPRALHLGDAPHRAPTS